jgi:hypothetical protein
MKRRRHSDPLGRIKDVGSARDRSTVPCLGCRSGDAKHLTGVLRGQPGPRVGTPDGSAAADRVRRIRRIQPIPFRWPATGPRPVSMSGAKRWRGEW